jgi:hypothetical protein
MTAAPSSNDRWIVRPDDVIIRPPARKYSPDQPRDHGRFAEVDTGGLGNVAVVSGGFSINENGDNPSSGWMVSQAGTERSFSIEDLASAEPNDLRENPVEPWHDNVKAEVNRFISDNRSDLSQPGTFLGGWVDEGRLYLDVSHNIQSKDEAMTYAEDNDQLAAFNAGTGEYVRFDQEPAHAASRGPEPKREKEKVFLEAGPDVDPDEVAERMIRALFG